MTNPAAPGFDVAMSANTTSADEASRGFMGSPTHITCGPQNGPQVSGQVFEMLRKLSHDFNVPLTRPAAEVIASAQNSPR
jgi:hypothetical protein